MKKSKLFRVAISSSIFFDMDSLEFVQQNLF